MDIPVSPHPPETKPKTFGVLALLGLIVGVLVAFFRAWVWSAGSFNDEAFGYAIGGLFIPGLIAYAIAGRKKVRNLNRFAFAFCALCVFSLLIEVSSSGHPLNMKDRFAGLMKEAASGKSGSPGDNAMDTLVRDIFKDMLDQKKSYDGEVAKLNEDLAHIYSAGSFSSKASMQRSIKAVQEIVALDQGYYRQLQALPQHIKDRVDKSSLDDSDKEGFMKGINNSYANSKLLAVRQQAGDVEGKWGDATIALYNFALAHSDRIRVKDTKIIINDEHVRAEFNQDLKNSQDLRKSLQAFNSQIEQLQQDNLQQVGLTKKDLKLDSDNQPAPH